MQLSFDFFRFIKFHINCLNTIFIFNIGVCSFHQTNKEKSFTIQIYLEVNYWFIYIKVIPNCCESSSVFTIPLNNGQMYAKLEKTSDF